jgi:hypothetical protein
MSKVLELNLGQFRVLIYWLSPVMEEGSSLFVRKGSGGWYLPFVGQSPPPQVFGNCVLDATKSFHLEAVMGTL